MRWVFMVATGLLLLLYIANLPFYSGAHFGDEYSWRMEHGRLSIKRNAQRSPRSARESFYIALNSEGLRWSWEWRSYSEENWKIAIPLWAPLAVCAAGLALTWRRRAQRGEWHPRQDSNRARA